MPFGLKLKKSRHYYKVMSKSLFVLSIQLLDSATIDCTLSSESTGQECLENVCQRISIGQPEFFGLRYIVKGTKDEVRWVDLERPLNRQLEKYAADTKTLYLRVMYYVISGVSLINDEVTRNYYFLQLKRDIVEGKISCEPKQAVVLGNYSRQAEYGNHQDRHTVEYLKSLLSFPKHLIEAGLLETLTEEVIKQHAELHNVTQGAAEEFYISRCQQLDGYGQETFTAKDELGNEVMLGISVSGIIVACSDAHKFYPWRDISNVVNHKRTFNIECTDPENSVGFTLMDAETGRYVWKLCVLQHTFFMKFEQNQSHPTASQMNLFANVPENLNESRDDLLAEQQQQHQFQQQQQMLSNWQASTETQISNATTNSNNQNNNAWFTPETTPVTASTISMAASNNMLMQSRNSLQASALDVNQQTSMNPWGGGGLNGVNSGSNASLINRAQSSSCLDLSNNNNNNNNTSSTNINQDRERLKALLPTYRPAPDYETAVQQKYHTSSNELRFSANPVPIQPSHFQLYNPTISGSQPDVHSANAKLMQMYPDVTHHTTTNHLLATDLTQQFKMMKFVKPAPPPYAANRLSSTSTPDLALASHRALLGGYPSHIVSGSSPDLVSSRTFVSHHPQHQQQQHTIYHHHPHMAPQNHHILYAANPNAGGGTRLRHSHSFLPHGTYENLNFLEPSAATKTSLLATKHHHNLQNVYDAGNNVIYCLPRGVDVEHILLQNSTAAGPAIQLSTSNQHINGSIEPIYENIPLPWKNDTVDGNLTVAPVPTMRERASSQSATSVIRKQQLYAEKPLPPTPNATVANSVQFPSRFPTPSERTESLLAASNKLNTHPAITKTNSNPVVTNTKPTTATPPPPTAVIVNNNNNNISAKKHPLLAQSAADLDNNNKNHSTTSSASRIESLNRSSHSTIIDTSTNSSTYTMNTTNSEISSVGGTGGSGKEKRSRKIWQILGGGRSKSSSNRDVDKQKSATLGREKEKYNKKSANKSGKELEAADSTNIRHRWSTGLPRMQPLPTNVSKESLCQQLEAKAADSQLWSEFERIPKRKENAKFECALHEENANKNLDSKYLPYDDNRVRITPTRENRMGYVNASHITSTVGTKQRFYIAAQTPHNPISSTSFWQSVWEADVYLLVQLSDEVKYVPPNSERFLEFGQYQVWREFSQENDRCVTSKLRVYHTQSRRYRSIWHLSYSDWGEHDTPKDVANFCGFLEELNSVRLASFGEIPPGHNTNPPVLIHCSEGGGRSGVTLLADLLLYTLDHNQDLDIPRVVGQLRQQRDSIIPSLAQYRFIYALLIHYLKQTRLI